MDKLPQPSRKQVFVHFPRTLAVSFFLFVACLMTMYLTLGHYSAEDEAVYRTMVNGDDAQTPEVTRSRQERTGLQKNIFFRKSNQEKQISLKSSQAELVLEKVDGNAQVVENMQDVVSWMQEGLYYLLSDGRQATLQKDGRLLISDNDPALESSWLAENDPAVKKWQSVLFLTAKEASYHYKNDVFAAQHVKAERYVIPGHHVPKNLGEQESKAKFFQGNAIHSGILSVEAERADYSEGQLALEGHVRAEHQLGVIFADQMVMQPVQGQDKSLLDHVIMQGNVRVEFANGRTLACGVAEIDAKGLKGTFIAGPGAEFVVYSEDAVTLKAQKMDVLLLKGDQSKMFIRGVTADGDVSVDYRDFVAASDHAVYTNGIDTSIGGKVTMQGNSPDRLCRVTNTQGDVIFATQIEIDVLKKLLVFTEAKGSLSKLDPKAGKISFIADKLTWNDAEQMIALKGDVSIVQEGIGKLQTPDEVRIALGETEGKKAVNTIQAKGETILNYTDQDIYLNHVLKCYGTVKVDHQKMETRLLSPKDDQGNVIEGCQVFFEDPKGDIYADRAFVKYEIIDGALAPVRIVLEGNVRLTNHQAPSDKDNTPGRQYILAEHVEFFPRTKEMVFKGSKEQRVLLFDKAKNLQVSAPMLKLIRDKALNKESVQGLGDVRMSFVEQELEKLQRRFSFDKTEKESGANGAKKK